MKIVVADDDPQMLGALRIILGGRRALRSYTATSS